MRILTDGCPPVKPGELESDPATWGPEWDDWYWEPTEPTPEDLLWAAQTFGERADDFDVEPAVDEHAALASAALDAIEMGLIPPDLAESLGRTSLVGLADAILHEGSPPASCRCWSCIEIRTRHYAE